MKRPLAYITAAWCGDPDTDMEIAARYCRMAYEAGFSPICPILYLSLFINDAIPEEHKNGIDMRRDIRSYPGLPGLWKKSRKDGKRKIYIFL